jgi:hypothetical protein
MEKYASFNDYIEGHAPRKQAIIRALRRLVKRVSLG